MKKRRLLKEILNDIVEILPADQAAIIDEIIDYMGALPLFRIDVAMPVVLIHSEIVMVTRFVWAFSGRMNRWYYGWFAIERATSVVSFRTDHGYRGSMHADILLWMESIPHSTRFTQPIINNFYEKEKVPATQDTPRKRKKKGEEV